MNEERAKRKLSGILSADAVGYSRLMRQDEAATVATLKAHKEVMAALIERYRGRIVDSPGDNLLAEFGSVVNAVECAVEIQKALKTKNDDLPDDRKMAFRIGIHLGDVLEEEDRIYGDGVNIAARIEGLAESGGVCISRTTYDSVKDKLSFGYEYLGEHPVKNISEPIRVYRILTEPEDAGKMIEAKKPLASKRTYVSLGALALIILMSGVFVIWNNYFRVQIEPASLDKMAFPLPDQPSIAVLPFDNMSADPEQEYLGDALSDQIISGLSKMPYLFVIDRNSTFTYKGKPVKVQKVAEDLGVRYVLEGSVQRSAARVRITARLIDAITGRHQWSERYDRDLEDIFAIQDEITLAITKALNIELIEGDQARLWQQRSTTNLKAYLKYLEGLSYFYRATKEDNTRARQLFEEALALDAGYASAYGFLGFVHFFDARYGWVESRGKSIETAYKYAQKAIELDDTLDTGHLVTGGVYLLKRQHEKTIDQGERAIAINPNGASNNVFMAGALGCAGRWEEGIEYARKAIRLAPFSPVAYYWILGRAFFMTGQYDKAVETFKKAVEVNPDFLVARAFLAASYSSLDRQTEAAAEAAEVLRINPKFTLESYAKTLPYKNKANIEDYMTALRKAGLPEHPPLKLPDKPSIAVLAFDNLSGDPKQDYFGDGITDEIITALSKSNDLFVIARNSSFSYKGKPVKIQQVSKELGVKYILEGSFKRSGDRLRINAQLIDAINGKHLWAERYDRKLRDIFEIQDDITKRIIASLKVKLTIGESARVYAKDTNNLDAYLKVMQAWDYHMRFTKEDNYISRGLAEEGIAMDPQYGSAYVLLSATYMLDTFLGDIKNRKQNLGKAIELAKKGVDLEYIGGYAILGYLYSLAGQDDKAIAECKKAVELDPNASLARAWYGAVLYKVGQYEAAVQELEQAVRRDPMAGTWVLRFLGSAYSFADRHDDSIKTLKTAIQKAPNDYLTRLIIIRAYIFAGRQEKAEAEAAEVLKLNPKFSLENYAKRMSGKDKERSLEAFRRAGLK